jgi:hypothetical protein
VIDKGTVFDREPAIIAGIVRAANGDLLCAFNSGGDLGPGQYGSLVRSVDLGRTWGDPERTFSSVYRGGGVEIGCSLTRLASGRLLLPYADGFYLHPGTTDYERRALLFCPYSDDHGRTWQGCQAQPYEGLEAFAFGQVAELRPDDLLLPLWGAYRAPSPWIPAVLRSADGGVSWGQWTPIADHGDETPVVALPDGRAMALLRDWVADDPARPLHGAWSSDAGRTWTPPQRLNLGGTSPSLHLSANGRLYAGFRSTLPGCNCHVASSGDGGVTWQWELELELVAGEWSYGGYPVLEDLPDGRLIVVFHNGTPPDWHVYYNVLADV